MDVGQLLTLLLGGGATATIVALFNGVKSLREGSRSRERDTITDLIARRAESDEERDKAIADRDRAFSARDRAFDERDHWRNRAGELEFICNTKGYPVPPLKPFISNDEPLRLSDDT